MSAYECPVCGVADPHAYLRCNRPDCPDGRDPRPRSQPQPLQVVSLPAIRLNGRESRHAGLTRDANPHIAKHPAAFAWDQGWLLADEESKLKFTREELAEARALGKWAGRHINNSPTAGAFMHGYNVGGTSDLDNAIALIVRRVRADDAYDS